MTEWGTPDWRDASAYDAAEAWNVARWRWEFFRRRDDLREYFDKHADETERYFAEQYKIRPEGQPDGLATRQTPGFAVRRLHRRADGGIEGPRELFGYSEVPNPRIGDQPQHAISEPCSASIKIDWSREDYLSDSEKKLAFDLDRPLEPQINLARDILRRAQAKRLGAVRQPRKHPAKWPDYLRALDAREAGASWRTIYEIVLAPTGRYSDKNPEKTASDVWDAARTLQFNFPA